MFARQNLDPSRKDLLIKGLSLLPPSFVVTPTNGDKTPYRKEWQHELSIPRNVIANDIRTGKAKGYGLRTGEVSSGVLALDIDGHLANALLQQLSNGQKIPETVAFTSGLPGKCQYLLQVPQEYWGAIATKKFKTKPDENGKPQLIELRWGGCQSVLPPSVHPETGSYKWVAGCSPTEREIAPAPDWLIELMLVEPVTKAETQAQPNITATEISRARSYLAALSTERADDYDTWLKIGMALHTVDDCLLKDWEDWSQQSSKYKQGDCQSKWKSFKRKQTDRRVTIASLGEMAIADGWQSNAKSNRFDNRRSGGDYNLPVSKITLEDRVKEILERSQSQSERKSAFISLAESTKVQLRELEALAEAIESDAETSIDLADAKVALPKLLETQNRTIDPSDYLWGDGGRLAQAMKTVAFAMPTSPAMIFTTFIPASASRIGTSSRIVIKPSARYKQPCVFWAGIVARSGQLKSPAQSVAIDPLVKLEIDSKKAYDKALQEYEEAKENWQEGDSKPKKPEPRKRYITKDSTLETLESIHSSNPRGLLYYRDELAAMHKSRNAFKANGTGADAEAELDQWNGAPLIIDRKQREIAIDRTAISRTGSIQYEILQSLAGDHLDSNGNMARWLFCAVKSPPRYINFDNLPDTRISELLETLYRNLEKLPTHDYLIDKDAQDVFKTWQHNLVDAERQENHPGLKLIFPKIEAYGARFALWLHCVNAILAGETPQASVNGKTMRKAVQLASFYLEQAKLLYAANSPQYGLTGRLLKIHQFAEGKPQGITARDVKRNLNEFRKIPTSEIKRDFSTLVETGNFQVKDDRFIAVGDFVGAVGDLSVEPPTSKAIIQKESQPFVGAVGDFNNESKGQNIGFKENLSSPLTSPKPNNSSITTDSTDKIYEAFIDSSVDSVGDKHQQPTDNPPTAPTGSDKSEFEDFWNDESDGAGGSTVINRKPLPTNGGGATSTDNPPTSNNISGESENQKLSTSIESDRALVHLVEEDDKPRLVLDEFKLDLHRERGFELEPWKPTLRVKSYEQLRRAIVDIESIGLNPDTGRIIAIGLKMGEQVVLMSDRNEAAMLKEFNKTLAEWQPNVLAGHNAMAFDFPFIIKRCQKHGIKPPFKLAKKERLLRATSVNAKAISYTEVYANRIDLLDSYHLIAKYDFSARKLSSLNLKTSVIELELRQSPRLELTPEEIKQCWESNDLETLKTYLREDLIDCELLLNCFAPIYHYQSLVVPKLSLQQLVLAGNATKWQRILEDYYGNAGIQDEIPECVGALRLAPKPGLFRNVGEIDVSSLYPSIMLRYGIHSSKDIDRHSLRVLQYLTSERLKLKALGQDGDLEAERQSGALKILINSLTGALGTNKLGFNDAVGFSLVTGYGRLILQRMIQVIEQEGGQICYADTDGISFVSPDIQGTYTKVAASLPNGIELDRKYKIWDALFIPPGKNGEGSKCTYVYWTDSKVGFKGGRYTNRNNPIYSRDYEIGFLLAYLDNGLEAAQIFHKEFITELESGKYPTGKLSCKRVVQANSKFKHLAKVGEKATYWIAEGGTYTNEKPYDCNHYNHQIELLHWELLTTLGHEQPKPNKRKKKAKEPSLFQLDELR